MTNRTSVDSAPHHPNDCGCSGEWRKPKPSGTCATCGGWLPGERGPSLTEMWAGSPFGAVEAGYDKP